MNPFEAFQRQESRVDRTIVFIDLVDSTAMKSGRPEADWLNTLGWFYATIAAQIQAHEGHIVKYLGDGAMAAFSDERVTNAINASIHIQEAMDDARHANTIQARCTIGITSGRVVTFGIPNIDYVGYVVDTAARLCSAGQPNAVLVDSPTIHNASLGKLESKHGKVARRKADGYRGASQTIQAKGFAKGIECYEILWAENRFGIKTSHGDVHVVDSAPG